MLTNDFRAIGNRLYAFRKQAGLTQVEVAEKAGMSDRTYSDIERGTVNMRLSTILRICAVLHITPNEILTEEIPSSLLEQQKLFDELSTKTETERNTALRILDAYLQSTR